MKSLMSLFFALVLFSCSTNDKKEETTAPTNEEIIVPEDNKMSAEGYDKELANQVGADDYGMRQYVLAYLKQGPNRDLDSLEAAELQRAHLNNITRLAKEGKLVLAGPFMDDGEIRGIYIFAVESLEEAEKIAISDPAIESGSLVMELHPWYGSAALMKVNDWHKRISKEPI